ncbi:MAG TPA: hypothetical protein VMY76_11900 [Gemmatimonadales bacterium]|nr:hypothetical protein [Gemmatimonadales bacterium]
MPQAIPRGGAGAPDPRIDALYHSDVRIMYGFAIAMWVVLWFIFFAVAKYVTDSRLLVVLFALNALACLFNTVGLVQNVRRLGQERLRFYSQDLYWQDQRQAQRAL